MSAQCISVYFSPSFTHIIVCISFVIWDSNRSINRPICMSCKQTEKELDSTYFAINLRGLDLFLRWNIHQLQYTACVSEAETTIDIFYALFISFSTQGAEFSGNSRSTIFCYIRRGIILKTWRHVVDTLYLYLRNDGIAWRVNDSSLSFKCHRI